MADAESTIKALKSLQTELLGYEWINEVWNQEFADYDPITNEYQELLNKSDNHLGNLKHIHSCMKKWIGKGRDDTCDGFWTSLVEHDISRKGIIAILFYIYEIGQKKVANAIQKEASIVAADVYFSLISIPGSGAFKIYHPVLFEKMVNVFKTWDTLEKSGGGGRRKRPSSPMRSSQTTKQGKAGRRAPGTQENDDPFAADMESEEVEDEDTCELTLQEAIKLQKTMIATLGSFVMLLSSYSLKGSEHVLIQISQVLADLSRFEADLSELNFEVDIPLSRMRTVSQLAFKGMNFLCNGLHGESQKRVSVVFKYLLPSLLMLVGKNKKSSLQSIPRHVINNKDVALAYVCHLLKSDMVDVAVAAYHIVQQMCIQVPDKVDYRTKVAKSIIDIIKLFPVIEYAKTIQWIHKFSRSNKIGLNHLICIHARHSILFLKLKSYTLPV